ncbi:ATP-dependent DNA helicase RecG [Streptomyces sp. CB01881]|uniref:ATP-dependent DNA helicase RecG n=1 Tax=Streptomyces sp. CB01881 TaxID=2078691 RepID=UPI000CDBC047|nr:ATP-dependent DNA helicase RecG [Streptomyces sp. CB01881]AUY49699.1 ATP-dependent DNA helicase RecG [Streptomyces sp. CB01881]TYC73091.1 ATP-dependent DNA helicase RecG [Streptomyces sp. CB01881]
MGALDEPLTKLVGDRTAKVLADSLKLRTVGDLLHHYPRRYVERGQLTSLDELEIDEHVTVLARIEKVTLIPFRGRKGDRLEVVVTDGRSRLSLVFFNQGWRQKDLKAGAQGLFAGKVGVFNRTRQLVSPDYQLLDEEAGSDAAQQFAGRLIPVYGASAQMPSWKLSICIETALTKHLGDVGEPLPAELRERHDLIPLPEALELIHRPRSQADRERAQGRLRWDEAFVLQVALAQRRAADSALPAKPRRAREGGLLDAFDARLPFTLTEGQEKVSAEIAADLASEHPMHRLLQGEVGSGKTLVALRAMLAVVDAGGQAVLLAPTEVLAQQHHRSVVEMMGDLAEGGMLGGSDLGTRVVLLTGSMGVPARRQALLDMACGDAGIAIGTHALIEDKVQFQDLGLVVVDEQHRFGVEQRDALRAKGEQPPHLLVMTATPIPRTVAMTVFGDLETSVLDQLPAGRSPISTHVVPAVEKPNFLARAWERVREEAAKGHQAYVVCPRIGDEEPADPKAAKKKRQAPAAEDDLEDVGAGSDERRPPLSVVETAEMLAKGPLAGLRVEILHGRLAPDAKDEVMRRFAAGEVDVLVATTVIEVGVNVPNSTAMVIMDADRFGVSQLHQLRGRVGRGSAAGLCLLVSDMPAASPARARLDAVAGTLDGFELSRIDLEQRREGDVLGQAQSGVKSSLKVLSVLEDEEVIVTARAEATRLVAEDPALAAHPDLRTALESLLDADRAAYMEKG